MAIGPLVPRGPSRARGRLAAIGTAAFVATLVIPAIGPLWIAYGIGLAAVGLLALRRR